MTTNPAHGLRGLIRPWLAAHNARYRSPPPSRAGPDRPSPRSGAALAEGDARTMLPDGLHPTEAAVDEVALP